MRDAAEQVRPGGQAGAVRALLLQAVRVGGVDGATHQAGGGLGLFGVGAYGQHRLASWAHLSAASRMVVSWAVPPGRRWSVRTA